MSKVFGPLDFLREQLSGYILYVFCQTYLPKTQISISRNMTLDEVFFSHHNYNICSLSEALTFVNLSPHVPDSGKSEILGFGIRNPGRAMQNPKLRWIP